MSFDNPYFPTQFDVGTINGDHSHFDSAGIHFYGGAGGNTLEYEFTAAHAIWYGSNGNIEITPNAPNGLEIQFTVPGLDTAGYMFANVFNVDPQGELSLAAPRKSFQGSGQLALVGSNNTNPAQAELSASSSYLMVQSVTPGTTRGGVVQSRVFDGAGNSHDMTWEGNVSGGPHAATLTVDGVLDTTGRTGRFFQGWNAAGPAIANNTWTNIGMGSTNQAGGFNYSQPVNGGAVPIPRAGDYKTTAHFSWTSNATGFRAAQIRVNSNGNVANGSELGYTSTPGIAGTNNGGTVDGGIIHLLTTDTIEFWVYQSSGGALTTFADLAGLSLTIEYIGE